MGEGLYFVDAFSTLLLFGVGGGVEGEICIPESLSLPNEA